MNINLLVEQLLRDGKFEKNIFRTCERSETDYFYDHYEGEISEQLLYDYSLHAKRNRQARVILKQIVRYCNAESLSSRVLSVFSSLPKKDFETCCHYLAHCPLSFLQQYSIFIKCRSSEMLVDLLSHMCVQKQFTDDDIRYLMTYMTEESAEVIRYFAGTFNGIVDDSVKKKLEIICARITGNTHND